MTTFALWTLLASTQLAQLGLGVNETTGQAGYTYEIPLPAARGRFQPSLVLSYSSGFTANVGYGYGWSVNASRIVKNVRAGRQVYGAKALEHWINIQGAASRLVFNPAEQKYRPEVSGGYLAVQNPSAESWTAQDGAGNAWHFSCATNPCSRWGLSFVNDADGNGTSFHPDAFAEVPRWYNYNTAVSAYETKIELVWEPRDNAGSIVELGGEMLWATRRLAWVKVTNRSQDGSYVVLRSYQLVYASAPDTGMDLLRSITEWGGDGQLGEGPGTLRGGTTTFEYGPSDGQSSTQYGVGAPVGFTLPPGFAHPAWIDIDLDGRPDLVEGTQWARNTTPFGAGSLSFGAPAPMANATQPVSFSNANAGTPTSRVLHFDDDGLLDILEFTDTETAYLRRGTAGGNFGAAVAVDASAPLAYLRAGYPAATIRYAPRLDVFDVTGDGVVDLVVGEDSLVRADVYWHVFPGMKEKASGAWRFSSKESRQFWGVQRFNEIKPTNTCPGVGVAGKTSKHAQLDMNGDGLVDHVCTDDDQTRWSVQLNRGDGTAGVTQWSAPTTPAANPWVLGMTAPGYFTDGCLFQRQDSFDRVAMKDLNGDGLVDWIYSAGTGTAQIFWNTGTRWAAGPTVSFPGYPAEHFIAATTCDGITPVPERGIDAQVLDVNGDGVADYTRGNQFYRGYRNGSRDDLSRSVLLSRVVIPDGASFDVSYVPASGFGASFGAPTHPVVKSITMAGPAMAPSRADYWYGMFAAKPGATDRSWPGRLERRGFTLTWARDSVTQLMTWRQRKSGDSSAFAGLVVQEGTATAPSAGDTFSVPVSTNIKLVVTDWAGFSVRSPQQSGNSALATLAGTCDRSSCSEILDANLPALVLPAGVTELELAGAGPSWAASRSIFDAARVDIYGNALMAWSSSCWTTYTGATPSCPVEGGVRQTWTNPSPACKTCPQNVDSVDANGVVKLARQYVYDAQGRLVREAYAEPGITRTYFPNGNLNSVTYSHSGITVTTSYEYQDELRVRKTRVSAGGPALVTENVHDPATARLTTTVGPYVEGSSLPVRSVAYAYDPLGRLRAVGRSATASGMDGARQALEYADSASPRAVTSYSFAIARNLDLSQPLSASAQASDVRVVHEYRDGLGRAIQRRERLGTAQAAPAAANIAENVNLWRVSGVVLDGAGRPMAEFEPFHAPAGASGFQELRGSAPSSARPGEGVRAASRSYDSRSRVWCSMRQAVGAEGLKFPATAAECADDESDSAQFSSAVETVYGLETGPDGLAYATVGTQRRASPGATPKLLGKTLLDPLGRVTYALDVNLNRTRYVRDALGREIAMYRETSDGSRSVAFTREHDLAGRVWRFFDYAAGRRAEYSYDAASRIETVKHGPISSSAWAAEVRYLREARGLDRVTRVEQVGFEWNPVSGLVEERRTTVGDYFYDSPYAYEYAFTAGAVAYATNDNATVIFGYDDGGRLTRRDQKVLGFPGTFRSSQSLRDDGRPLSIAFATEGTGGTSDAHPFSQAVEYDSAGRPFRISSGGTPLWALPTSQALTGPYDALDRPEIVLADASRALTSRQYSPNTGFLTQEIKSVGTTTLFDRTTRRVEGRVSGYTDQVPSSEVSFQYHDDGKLETASSTPSNVCDPLAQLFSETYGFRTDKAPGDGPSIGNLERTTDDQTLCGSGGTPQVAPTQSETYEYDIFKADQLAWVKATNRPAGGTGARYEHDWQDRLKVVHPDGGIEERLLYGPLGDLVARHEGATVTAYVAGAATVVAALNGCPEPSATCQVSPATMFVDAHVTLGATRIASARMQSGGRILYYFRDELGSVIATSLAGGTVGAQYRYTPYGELDRVLGENANSRSDLGYTGALKISGGLLFLVNRTYDPRLRRFLEPDTIDPLRYTYVRGDPANLTDPNGREPTVGRETAPTVYFEGIMVTGAFADRLLYWMMGAGPNWRFIDSLQRYSALVAQRWAANNNYGQYPYSVAMLLEARAGRLLARGSAAGAYWLEESPGTPTAPADDDPTGTVTLEEIVVYVESHLAHMMSTAWGAIFESVVSPVAQEIGKALVDRGYGFWRGVATVGVQVGLAVTYGILVSNPVSWVALAGFAAVGAVVNVGANQLVARFFGEEYGGGQIALDAGIGAIGGLVSGLMSVSGVLAGNSAGVAAGQAIWGLSYGLASGALEAGIAP